ncbi:MAG: pyrimidine 5'-nucleotidase [Burkholderiales bacterium]
MSAHRAPRRFAGAERAHAAADAGRPVWLLDLDNTLHDALRSIMPRINRAMTEYVMRRTGLDEAGASALRVHSWRRYGATLLGMVRHHAIDPHEFLRETHPFPDLHALVRRDVRLAHLLRRLPGRKIVVTNAPEGYARGVLAALGVAPLLDGMVSIEAMTFAGRWCPKPSRPMMHKLLARLRLPASRCVLVEDTVENLRAARRCGVRTVWVSGIAWRARPAWQRPRRGQRGIDVHVRTVVQLARTPLASRIHGHRSRSE